MRFTWFNDEDDEEEEEEGDDDVDVLVVVDAEVHVEPALNVFLETTAKLVLFKLSEFMNVFAAPLVC